MADDPSLILVLGGARSGKSAFAQRLASGLEGPVLFVATGVPTDEEMAARIAAHRAARPPDWLCLEAPIDVGKAIRRTAPQPCVVLVDCLSFLVSSGMIGVEGAARDVDESCAWERIVAEIDQMLEAARERAAHLIVVSNEVGMSVVPEYPLGRVYRDLLGRANQELAGVADTVYLMVAGLPVDIKRLTRPPTER
jgi:adenosylcobinamide kinase / adenosylcobinamide-phosphate guanylyltransferase